MRLACAALALSVLLLASPAQGAALVTVVTGAGTGTASHAGCEQAVPIAFHLTFGVFESPVLFPNPLECQGYVNAFVNDCRQEPSGIVCDGSYEDEGSLSISHEGVFHYERVLDGELFTVDGLVAFNQVVVPAL